MTNPFGDNNNARSNPSGENYGQGGYGSASGNFGTGQDNYGSYGGGSYGAGGSYGGGSDAGLPQYGAQPQAQPQSQFQDQPQGQYQGQNFAQQPYGYQGGGPAGGTMAVQPVDAFGAIGQAFKAMFGNFGPYILASIVHCVVIFALIFIPVLAGGLGAAWFASSSYDPVTGDYDVAAGPGVAASVFLYLFVFVGIFYQFWMLANFLMASKISADGGKPQFKDFFRGGPTIGVSVVVFVTFLIVTVGTFLLIIPGIIAAIFFFAAPAIKADEPDASVGECLKRSASLVKDNLGLAALLCICIAIISGLLSMVPFAVLISYPLIGLAMVIFTRQMQQRPVFRWA
ncbi:hypothetical protein [Corynebacterium sp.]|uniref:hypothetical protein n=1 Tax=Corynebacterium sp. TaxID=1720 RepID=UPI0026DB451D|nr:hypothetical protein [Corynebacterium sp.]MDO5031493.1 hypothetical protein [Corynebacterium sp.]